MRKVAQFFVYEVLSECEKKALRPSLVHFPKLSLADVEEVSQIAVDVLVIPEGEDLNFLQQIPELFQGHLVQLNIFEFVGFPSQIL